MRTMLRARSALYIFAAPILLAIALTACGSDDDSGPTATATASAAVTGATATEQADTSPTASPGGDIGGAEIAGRWNMKYKVTATTGTGVVAQVGDLEDWSWELESSCSGGACNHGLTSSNAILGGSSTSTLSYSNGTYNVQGQPILYTNCTLPNGTQIQDSHNLSTSLEFHVAQADEQNGQLQATALEGTRIVRADATEVGRQNLCSSFTVTYQITGARQD